MNFHKKNLVILGLVFLLSVLWIINYIFFTQKTARKSKAEGESVTLSFSPPSSTAASGVDFTTTVKATPSLQMVIRGYVIKINFDKTKVQMKDIQYKLGAVSSGLGDDNSKLSTINQNGYAKIMGEIQTATGQVLPTTATDIVSVTFTSTSVDASTINTEPAASKFYKINQDGSISEIAIVQGNFTVNGRGATETPTPTGGGADGGAGNVTLNLKLKFQGILKKPAAKTMTVRVKLGGAATTNYQSATFTADDNGIWSGTSSFNTTPAAGFIVYVKGPKHIQKKVCVAAPTETSPGTYRCPTGQITLAAGANDLDFSGIYQLAGDLPEQDGVVNSYDTSLVRNNLGKTDDEALRLADINLDGRVDSQDYSLIIAALSVRADEE